MNPCSPGNSLTQKQAKVLTDFKLPKKFLDKLSEENICSIYKQCEGNDLPVPPLNLFITRTHLYYIDPKSPLKPEDYDVLFGKSKKKDIQKISKKMNLVVDSNESMGEIKGAIMAFFKKKNILEPVKIKLKYDKDIPRELNLNTENAGNTGNSGNMGNTGNSGNMGNIKPTINSENIGTTLTPVNTENKKNGPTPPPVNLKVNKKNEKNKNTPTPPPVNLKVPNRPQSTTTTPVAPAVTTPTPVAPAVTATTGRTNVGNVPKPTGNKKTNGSSKFGFPFTGNRKPRNIKKNRNKRNANTPPTNLQYRDFIRLLTQKYGYGVNFSKYKKSIGIPGLASFESSGYTNEGIYEMEAAIRKLLGKEYRIDTRSNMDIVLRKLEGEDITLKNFEDLIQASVYAIPNYKRDVRAQPWKTISDKYKTITGKYLYTGDEIESDPLKRKEMFQKLIRALSEGGYLKTSNPGVTFGQEKTQNPTVQPTFPAGKNKNLRGVPVAGSQVESGGSDPNVITEPKPPSEDESVVTSSIRPSGSQASSNGGKDKAGANGDKGGASSSGPSGNRPSGNRGKNKGGAGGSQASSNGAGDGENERRAQQQKLLGGLAKLLTK